MPRVKITSNRMAIAKKIAYNQGSMVSASKATGLHYVTYMRRLGKLHKQWNKEGLYGLRSSTFTSIGDIDDDSKRVDMGLKYLDRYPIDESTDEYNEPVTNDDEHSDNSRSSVSIQDAIAKIREDIK